MKNRRQSRQSGSSILELALVLPLIGTMFFGTVGLGIMQGRYVQASQAGRDVAHMYSDGVDFTQTQARNIAIKLAGNGMTNAGGNAVFILSRVTTVYQVDCTAAGYDAGHCVNANLPVFISRITVGNATLRASKYGTPAAAILDSQGNISNSVYMQNTNSTVRTNGFEADYDDAVQRATGTAPTPPGMNQGDVVCVTEAFFAYPDINFLGWGSGGAYKRYSYRCS